MEIERFEEMIKLMGRETLNNLMPVSPSEMFEAFKNDEHLNNIPLKLWDKKAGKVFLDYRYHSDFTLFNSFPWDKAFSIENGKKYWEPLSFRVCLLKYFAKTYYMERKGA